MLEDLRFVTASSIAIGPPNNCALVFPMASLQLSSLPLQIRILANLAFEGNTKQLLLLIKVRTRTNDIGHWRAFKSCLNRVKICENVQYIKIMEIFNIVCL